MNILLSLLRPDEGPQGILVPLLLLTLGILMVTLLLVRLTLRRPIRRMTEWLRRVRAGQAPLPPDLPLRGILAPLAEETATLARSLSAAQAAAEGEARLRVLGDPLWTAEKLREHVRSRLGERPLVVVSNREPYRHVRRGGGIECAMPASGLVTGLEPMLRACGGTWVAHGDGDADRETADPRGRLRVPPEAPQYGLRRVWLTQEEESGYYYGFSNEGLWPLCHIAHTRPVFRAADWALYQRANWKFTEAVLNEIEDLAEPFVLVQDYHFTLLPRLIKEARPDARVALFWHIPWPNPEAFGICPWQQELLEGMLGADLIGFHTQYHCNNFLETADRVLECRIDRERFAVRRGERSTAVRPFPFSVEFPEPSIPDAGGGRLAAREEILRAHGIRAAHIGVGVDRLDYTKGILERFQAIERFLEIHPRYRGDFVFFQIGAPSRTGIPSYRDFIAQVEAEAARVNARFAGEGCPPIVLLAKHHSHDQIRPYYRAADLCLVSSLHDGMNLVAKEFVVSRGDERGVLVLSRFTGASRELRDAILINPYDLDETAEAVRRALEMGEEEQGLRMLRLRRVVRENNIYRWAASLLSELASIRSEPSLAR